MSLTLACEISRTELALANLALEDEANGYEIVSLGPGALSWRRETVRSPYVHGETLVTAVKDLSIAPMTVRVKASSAATLDTRLDALLDAFAQFEYSIGVTIDGVSKIWTCQPADLSVGDGGEFNKYQLMAKMYEVTLSIPRHPVPTSGSM